MLITHNRSVRLTKKRKEILRAAEWYAKKVGIFDLDVTVCFVFKYGFTDLFKVYAEVHNSSKNRINVYIDADISKDVHLRIALHEMIHVKQFILGEMGHDKKGNITWYGKKIPAKLPYWLHPWEIEACSKADLLMYEFCSIKG